VPIIASHHRSGSPLSRNNDYTPSCNWPDDCMVQWGGSGVVLSEDGGRLTAFFEAFPKGPGFFRGEGKTIPDAEKDCFEKWSRFAKCDHAWGRGFHVTSRSVEKKHGKERPKLRGKTHYTNGGAICKKCKAFASMFKPVVTLGAWRAPPSIHALTSAAEGELQPNAREMNDPKLMQYIRHTELKLRMVGIKLPPMPEGPSTRSIFDPLEDDPYALACRAAVVDWYVDHHMETPENPLGSMDSLFSALDHRTMKRHVEDEMEYRAKKAEADIPEHGA
jgi:hypothetical protein